MLADMMLPTGNININELFSINLNYNFDKFGLLLENLLKGHQKHQDLINGLLSSVATLEKDNASLRQKLNSQAPTPTATPVFEQSPQAQTILL